MFDILKDLCTFFVGMGKFIYMLYSFEHPIISIFSWFATIAGIAKAIPKIIDRFST